MLNAPQALPEDSDIAPSSERIFLCTEGGANKFWCVKVAGSIQTVHYGRIGTEGHELTKTFEGPVAASKATRKLIAEKLGKGYKEASDAEAQAARDAAREAQGDRSVTPPSALRAPRKPAKSKTPPWQQLLLSFDEEEGLAARLGVGVPTPPAPKPEAASVLAFEF